MATKYIPIVVKALECVGGVTPMAKKLGLKPQRVSNWRVRGVPYPYCQKVEAATGGKVTAQQLAPEVFGKAA